MFLLIASIPTIPCLCVFIMDGGFVFVNVLGFFFINGIWFLYRFNLIPFDSGGDTLESEWSESLFASYRIFFVSGNNSDAFGGSVLITFSFVQTFGFDFDFELHMGDFSIDLVWLHWRCSFWLSDADAPLWRWFFFNVVN